MKTLLRIGKPAPKQYPFQHSDLDRAIFRGKPPVFVDRPFASLHPSVLEKLPVHYNVGLFDDEDDSVWRTLNRSIRKVGKRDVTSTELFYKLPEWAINMLVDAYFLHSGNWRDYLYDEIEKFCGTWPSQMQWELFKRVGIQYVLQNPLIPEQKFWIVINSRLDKRDDTKFVTDIRESLLPWLNLDMYREQEKQKEKRTNVQYSEQHREMVEGTFVSDEKLDIIR